MIPAVPSKHDEKPQEQSVQHHRNELPVFDDLKKFILNILLDLVQV